MHIDNTGGRVNVNDRVELQNPNTGEWEPATITGTYREDGDHGWWVQADGRAPVEVSVEWLSIAVRPLAQD